MKRFAVPLVIAGSLAVLVALFMLLRAITSTSPAAPVTATPPRPTETASAAPAPAPTMPSPAPAPGAQAPTRAEPRPTAPRNIWDEPPAPPAGGSSDALPGTRANTKNLHFGLPQLREKIAANAPHVQQCLKGSSASGEATLTFIVAQRAGKIIIEQTDVDRDKTTVQDEPLLECLHKTAEKIQLDGLPREAEAIIVTRVMTLQDGSLAEDKPLKFSYLR